MHATRCKLVRAQQQHLTIGAGPPTLAPRAFLRQFLCANRIVTGGMLLVTMRGKRALARLSGRFFK